MNTNPIAIFFANLWSFFDGKKTVIGSALLMISTLMKEVVIDILEYDAPWEHKAMKLLNYIGFFLGGSGMAHRLMKKKEETAAAAAQTPATPAQ